MKYMQTLCATIVLSTSAIYSAERVYCQQKFCWFGHTNNPIVDVQLKPLDGWYHDEKYWTHETKSVEKTGKCSISVEKCVPILNIKPVLLSEWPKERDRGVEALISGFEVAPYSYADIIKTPTLNAYVMAKNYEEQKKEALNFIDKKLESFKTAQGKHTRSASKLLEQYRELIQQAPASQWHDCTGYIVDIRQVVAITHIISIAHAQRR